MINTVNVTCLATGQQGNPIAGATVTALLSAADVDVASGSYVLPELVTATTDATGTAILALWPNQSGAGSTTYTVKISDPNTSKTKTVIATIPNGNCTLSMTENLPVVASVTSAQLAANTATGAAVTANAQAGIATVQAVIATTQAANAGTSATNSANSATAAAASVTAIAGQVTNSTTQAANAASSATSAAAQAANATTASNAAQTANAAAQAAIGTILTPIESLAAINKSIHKGVIVDSFIYDTGKDSDGGAWRKRCQDKSWANESLSTTWLGQQATAVAAWAVAGAVSGNYFQNTTDGLFYQLGASSPLVTQVFRGNVAQFPEQVAIVIEAARIVIYDVTQPSLPMWMVFTAGVTSYTAGSVLFLAAGFSVTYLSAIFALNGKLMWGSSAPSDGTIGVIDFITERMTIQQMAAAYCGLYNGNISKRNTTNGYALNIGNPIIHKVVNDIHATVVDGTQVDPATGLPTPTIAVATNAGVSVITPSGAVNSFVGAYSFSGQVKFSLDTPPILNCMFGGSALQGSFYQSVYPYTAAVASYSTYGYSATPPVLLNNLVQAFAATRYGIAEGSSANLCLGSSNPALPIKAMVAAITNAYNSGWQVGDSRAALLADSVAGTAYGSAGVPTNPELTPNNGSFASSVGYTFQGTGWSISGGLASYASGGTQYARAIASIPTVVGRQYTATITVASVATSSVSIIAYDSSQTYQIGATTAISAAGTYSITFTALNTTSLICVQSNASVMTATVSAINVVQANVSNILLGGASLYNTSNWTANGGSTLGVTGGVGGGQLQVTGGSSSGGAGQAIPTVIGQTYVLTATYFNVSGGTSAYVALTDGTYAPDVAVMPSNQTASPVTNSITFSATAATTYIALRQVTAGNVGQFTNISVVPLSLEELVSNGTGFLTTAGWSQIVSAGQSLGVAGGNLVCGSGATTNLLAAQQITCVIGKTYQLQFTKVSAESITAYVGSGLGTSGIMAGTFATGAGVFTFNFVPNITNPYIQLVGGGANSTGTFSAISCKLVEMDRSVKGNGAVVVGSLTKTAVATGAQVVGYSGFTSSNYLQQQYNPNFDFGFGDFSIMAWVNPTGYGTGGVAIFQRFLPSVNGGYLLQLSNSGQLQWYANPAAGYTAILNSGTAAIPLNAPSLVEVGRLAGVTYMRINGVQVSSVIDTTVMTYANAVTKLGCRSDGTNPFVGSLSLVRISASAISANQAAYIYRTELQLFQANAQACIGGTSNNVTALAYDDTSDILSVGTPWGVTQFRDLLNVGVTPTTTGAVTSLSGSQNSLITGGATSANYYQPAFLLRDEVRRREEVRQALGKVPVFIDFDTIGFTATTNATATLTNVAITTGTPYVGMGITGTGIPAGTYITTINGTTYTLNQAATGSGTLVAMAQNTFTLPLGYTTKAVYSAGTLQRAGSTKAYTVSFDGYAETETFGTSPGNNVWVSVMCVRRR